MSVNSHGVQLQKRHWGISLAFRFRELILAKGMQFPLLQTSGRHFIFYSEIMTTQVIHQISIVKFSWTKWRWKTLEIVTFQCKIVESDKSGASQLLTWSNHTHHLWDSPSTVKNGDDKAYLTRLSPSWCLWSTKLVVIFLNRFIEVSDFYFLCLFHSHLQKKLEGLH